MIREEIKRLKTTPRDLRKFGLLVGGVFALIAGWLLFRHKAHYVWFAAAAAPLILLGAVYPAILRPVYLVWMTAALLMGLVMSTIILTLFYYLVLSPIAFIARLAGKDFLSRKLDATAKSYWIERDRTQRPSKSYEQQF